MIEAIISAAAGALGTAMNAISNRRARDVQQAQDKANIAYYQAMQAQNPLSRADNRNLLREYDRGAQRKLDQVQNSAIITGAPMESVLATQKNLIDGRADLIGTISANNQKRVDDAIKDEQKARETMAKNTIDYNKLRAASWGNLVSNAGSAFNSIDDSDFLNFLEKLKKKKNNTSNSTVGGGTTEPSADN